MTLFESLIALLLAAILLLQVSRRLSLPYPAMLAVAGVIVALFPGSPTIRLEPETALALFIAPALLDAAFDFPAGAVRRLWKPLVSLAAVAVLLTAGVVGWIGWMAAGLPIAAALALGAIVAPPDAAAATAILRSVSLPHRTLAVLKGESLLNDATALLLFSAAVTAQASGGIDGAGALKLGLAAPGGVLLGIGLAWIYRRLVRFVAGTLGGTLLEFVNTFWVWLIAERLGLSAVLCVVAFAMTVARSAPLDQRPRDRVHSYAVWETIVFLLNVFAFLLMGMQARTIVAGMSAARLEQAVGFAGLVIAGVVVTRLVWVVAYNRLAKRWPALRGDYEPATLRQGLIVGWTGMRGLLTLATAFALPHNFPQRDLIVLTAFAVVLATLVFQGITLAPLIRMLGLNRGEDQGRELDQGREQLAAAALAMLERNDGPEAEYVRFPYRLTRSPEHRPDAPGALSSYRSLALAAIKVQREKLDAMRRGGELSQDAFEALQEELDWKELAAQPPEDRRIEES